MFLVGSLLYFVDAFIACVEDGCACGCCCADGDTRRWYYTWDDDIGDRADISNDLDIAAAVLFMVDPVFYTIGWYYDTYGGTEEETTPLAKAKAREEGSASDGDDLSLASRRADGAGATPDSSTLGAPALDPTAHVPKWLTTCNWVMLG